MNFDQHAILHGIAIKKYASVDDVAQVMMMSSDKVAAIAADLVTREMLVSDGERYSLTPVAGVVLRGDYSRFYAEVRSSKKLEEAYDAFEALNHELKTLITQWQIVEKGGVSTPNDHTDEDYDNRIIDRLGRLHGRIEPVLQRFAKVVPRLIFYLEKLSEALDRVEEGDVAWVSDVRIASYHTVWFELHEDLLRILEKEREE